MRLNVTNLKKALKSRLSNKAFSLSLVAFVAGISIFTYGAVKAAAPVDCDENAVIKCGVYDKNKMVNQYNANTNGVKDVFNHFQINGNFSGTVDGYVTKDNRVVVGNQTVARNAVTVGRHNIAGSQRIALGGRTFYKRQPSTSFGSNSIAAYVKMENGQFKWAVLKSCGNPVQGNPTTTPNRPPTPPPAPTPKYEINKKVIVQDSKLSTDAAFWVGQQTVTASKNSEVRFVTMIRNTNKVEGGILAYDDLPSGAQYVKGTFQVKDAAGNVKQRGNLARISSKRYGAMLSLKAGYEIKLDIVAKYTADSQIRNVACVAPGGKNPNCDDAIVKPRQRPPTPPPAPTPKYEINKKVIVQDSKLSTDAAFWVGQQTVTASKNSEVRFVTMIRNTNKVEGGILAYDDLPSGAQYVKGTFQVKDAAGNVKQRGNLARISSKRYGAMLSLKAGYEIKLDIVAKYTADSQIRNVACVAPGGKNPNCDDAIVKPRQRPPTPTPSYACEALTVQKLSRTSFKFQARGSASGGAQVTGYIFKVNDRTVYDGNSSSYTYNQSKSGNYTVKAFIKTNKGNSKEVAACVKTITVEAPPEKPNYTIKKYVENRDAQNNESSVSVEPNKPFTYKIVIENTSNVELKNIKAWDVLPNEGITVQYVDGTLKMNGQDVQSPEDEKFFIQGEGGGIIIPSIGAKQKVEFTFDAKVVMNMDNPNSIEGTVCSPEGTFYNNIAKADPAKQGSGESESDLPEKQDPAVIKCTYTPPVKNPSVIIEKEVSKYEVNVGEEFTWYISVTNNGDVDLKDVVVSDEAPVNTEFLSSAAVDGITVDVNAKEFKATIAELKVGQKVTFGVQAKLTSYQNSDIVNTACVNAPEVNPNEPGQEDDCDDAKIKPVEKCTIPGKEDLDKNDSNCKEMCTIDGKENLAKDNADCKDENCIEVNGKVVSTVGKDGCEETEAPTKIATPNATPNTGLEAVAAIATVGASAGAFSITKRVQRKRK
jgi:uncharacterized repeat protein (TIGR01451 family)